jgi:hypothetical protein
MEDLFIKQTSLTPEIHFSPEKKLFLIKGNSAPEDVRALYYPVIKWIKVFIDDAIKGEYKNFSSENPIKFHADLEYFNSSSAKFLYDIFLELKRLMLANIPVIIEWAYDIEDIDQKEAGIDIASLVEMEFVLIPKNRDAE